MFLGIEDGTPITNKQSHFVLTESNFYETQLNISGLERRYSLIKAAGTT
jgi:hypothetical protein